MAESRLRILHAPADVGGHALGLSRGERELGLRSDVAVFAPGPFAYGADVDLHAGPGVPVPLRLLRRGLFLRRALRAYDVFHFNFGQTLLGIRQLGLVVDELRLLKRLGKTVVVTYQGCDVRPKAACPCRRAHCYAEDRYRRPAAERMLRFADQVFYLNPDLRRWLPGAEFCAYASVDPQRVLEVAPPPAEEELVVLHAPTDRDVKGTRHVVEAVERLRAEGVPARLDLVQGVTHAEVLERCAAAHVVVDQLLLGWYGGLAVEAMALGRPVVANIRDDEPGDNPFGAELPIVRTGPPTLADDLRALLEDAAGRERIGAEGRRFVEKHHDPRLIAKRILERVEAG